MKTQLEKWVAEAPETHFKQEPPVRISTPKSPQLNADKMMEDFNKHFPISSSASKKDYSSFLNELK